MIETLTGPPLPRDYQTAAINIGIDFFTDHKKKYNGVTVITTAGGKSFIIAATVTNLPGKSIVFQPSIEILDQNYEKFIQHGGRGGIYSASKGMKYVDHVTFATIGSVAKKIHLFKEVEYILIDECHLVNSKAGMYQEFIKALPKAKVMGYTATPYRLSSDEEGAMLKFLTRTRPRIFNKIVYYIQNQILFDRGYLAQLEYYSFNMIDRNQLDINSSGTDFTEQSIRRVMRAVNFPRQSVRYANQLLQKRKNLLIFCSLISEAVEVSKGIPGSAVISDETTDARRADIIKAFRKGTIRCVINVKVLTIGFDFPELECVLIARSTMSLALYYQMIGRVMRPFTYPDGTLKKGWVVDLGGNIHFFGKIETMKIVQDKKNGLHSVWNNGRQLTNVKFVKK